MCIPNVVILPNICSSRGCRGITGILYYLGDHCAHYQLGRLDNYDAPLIKLGGNLALALRCNLEPR